uniref:Anthranilate synthase component 2 n=1 Tax=Ptilothamnion sphaericum TaxID=1498216 RepID=A0A4D6X129_9FLOR|nr:Anthranilate synthase component II [Ptilothamnion sphaericum]QCI08340.1 Anthranilate synthase component II [Ptilothamnion sphaericum]
MTKKILIIDNYDSFTQNLEQYIGEMGLNIKVIRNDMIKVSNIIEIKPTHIILSPGPGHPRESKISLEIIQQYSHQIPILGICLGHQCIGYIYGGEISQLKIPMHGKVSSIMHNNTDIFYKLPNPFHAARYHSLYINNNKLPKELEATAWTKEGTIMGCRHKNYNMLRGIQFHPESAWTYEGKMLLNNFIYQ